MSDTGMMMCPGCGEIEVPVGYTACPMCEGGEGEKPETAPLMSEDDLIDIQCRYAGQPYELATTALFHLAGRREAIEVNTRLNEKIERMEAGTEIPELREREIALLWSLLDYWAFTEKGVYRLKDSIPIHMMGVTTRLHSLGILKPGEEDGTWVEVERCGV